MTKCTGSFFICFFKLKNLPWTQSLERLISLSEVKWCGMHVTKIPLWKACENLNILKTQMLRWISSWASYVWWRDQRAKITFPKALLQTPGLWQASSKKACHSHVHLENSYILGAPASESPRTLALEKDCWILQKEKQHGVILTCLFERLREERGVQLGPRQGGYILPSLRVSAYTRHCAEWLSWCLR